MTELGAPAPTLVVLQMAGGRNAESIALVERCRCHGPAVLLDYPDWPWYLDHAGFDALAVEMARRMSAAIPTGPLAIAGLSLGGALAPLAASKMIALGREVVWIAAVDPVRFRTSTIQAGWWTRTKQRGFTAGRGGLRKLALFFAVRMARIIARMLAPRLPHLNRRARAFLWALAPGERLLSQELRMRLLIDAGAGWTDPGTLNVANAPCTLFHTAGTPVDAEFWRSNYPAYIIVDIAGDHENMLARDAIDLFADRWTTIATTRIVSGRASIAS